LERSDDIEDQFVNAVKVALKTCGTIDRSPVVITEPARMHGRRYLDHWHIALLYMALTATVAILVVAALLE